MTMDERGSDLIQRAAARIRQQGAAAAPGAAGNADTASGALRRSRHITIDRGRLAQAGVAMPSWERSRVAEEFRIVKRGVLLNAAANKERGRLIMVTSARPREGKTFTALNLAMSFASERDMRVLIIDCDVHHQSLVQTLGIQAERGLIDLLTDSGADIADLLLRTNFENLTVLPSGRAGPQVPELLSSNRMADLVNEMVQRYPDRFIILDAPPCLATSDPSILAGLVGQIVFVVEANQTQEHEVAAALRLISACPTIGLVLNKTAGQASGQFGSYSYY